MLPDISSLSEDQRIAVAATVRVAKDLKLPDLQWFNVASCAAHETLADGRSASPPCQECGIELRAHQRIGVAWLYLIKQGMIADSCGTGKTATLAGLLAMVKEAGELEQGARVLVVCRSAAISQWAQQLQRMLPKLSVMLADGVKKYRIESYKQQWDICLISSAMLINDVALLAPLSIKVLVADDIDALRHPKNKAAKAIKRIARKADRVVILTATPLQKRLEELHSVLETVGGLELFGHVLSFRRKYIKEKATAIRLRSGRRVTKTEVVGYRNLDEFREKVASITLRRTAADIQDIDLPAVNPVNVFLELYPAQRQKYDELQRGVLRLIQSSGRVVSRTVAEAKFLYGAKICSGLATLGEADGPRASSKLDWLEGKLVDGDLSDEKVVVFIHFKDAVRALQRRLDRAGVSYGTLWGDEPSRVARAATQERFWADPACKVLIGTTSIEQSINLQVSRHLVNVDTIMNAARMTQLMGRIRRAGSSHGSVFIHNLIAMGTQEIGYLPVLEKEQALQDYIWGEESELYDQLASYDLLQLIGGSHAG